MVQPQISTCDRSRERVEQLHTAHDRVHDGRLIGDECRVEDLGVLIELQYQSHSIGRHTELRSQDSLELSDGARLEALDILGLASVAHFPQGKLNGPWLRYSTHTQARKH